MAYVYLLRCVDDSLYCGWTTDVARRLAAHRSGAASRYTRTRRPVELALVIPVAGRSAALREEARIKRLPRAAKLRLIEAARLPCPDSVESMASANVELVRAIYERFRADDLDAALALLDPEVEVHDRPEIPDPQVHRGHEGVLTSLGVSQETFDGLDLVPEEFLDAGDRVVVVFRFQGIGRESGIPIDERLVHVWTIRDGKAIRMEVRSDPDDARGGAGV